MHERVGNLHIHTRYSDGSGTHDDVAEAAAQAGLDFVIVTDHNAYPSEQQTWYDDVLLLVGEEVHSPANPDANHYLVLDAREDMAPFGDDPQRLIDAVREREGLGFIAHPYEHSGAFFPEPEINWARWEAQGFTGLEIWNYMSEFKAHLASQLRALLYAYWPELAIRGPFPETLARWDALCATGKVLAVGGSDAHATIYRLGPLVRRVFSYRHLFGAVNTHILVTESWSRLLPHDVRLVYEALVRGRAFVAYDRLGDARGFRFWAEHGEDAYTLGDRFLANAPVRFRARAPQPAHLRLIHNGFCVAEAHGRELHYISSAPGAYRVEAYRPYAFRERGWIFSNPIWVHTERKNDKR